MDVPVDRRTAIAGGLALITAASAHATAPTSDPEWVRRLLKELHPGLYRYQSPREFERRHARFAADWAARPALTDRFLALSRLTAAIRCGHSYPNPHNQSDAVVAALTGGRRLLPFRFRWIGTRMVVTGDPHGAGMPSGTEVLRIDGRPVADILNSLIPYARADGGNDGKRRALLSVTGKDEFETFDLYQPLLLPLGETVRLDCRGPTGSRLAVAVRTIVRTDRLAACQTRKSDPAAAMWSLARRGRTAILTMDDWSVYDSKWDWRSWLTAQLDGIAADGTAGLVIDLRANEGGQDAIGDLILTRLLGRPAETQAGNRLVRFRSVPADLRAPLNTWDKSFFDLGRDAVPVPRGYFRLPSEKNGGASASGLPFTGKVAVLTSPTSSSATFGFAKQLRDERRGLLVGETTGGNQRGINGGAYFFVRLPGSGLEFDLPLIGYFPDGSPPDAGLAPDIEVVPTPAAIASGRDEAMDRAIAAVA